MDKLKVTAIMLDGRYIRNEGIALDAILYRAYMLKHHPELFGRPCEPDKFLDCPLPLKKYGEVYLCTEDEADNADFNIEMLHRTVATTAYETHGNAKFSGIDHGAYKPYRIPLTVHANHTVNWYCVGDMAEIEDLLYYITAIGAKANVGYGVVKSWVVELTDFKTLTRYVPAEDGDIERAIKPPYFNKLNRRLCKLEVIEI